MLNETTSEDILVAGSYILLTFMILPVYLLLLYVFLTDKDFKKMQSYKLFVNLGVFDCLQLLFHWTAGVLILFPEICDIKEPNVCRFLGASLNSAWVGLFPATATIAVQRLYIVVRRINAGFKLTKLHKGLVAVGWMYALGFYVGLLTYGTVTFYPLDYSWGYGKEAPDSLMENVEYFVSLICIVISFIHYLIVISEIIYLKKLKHSTSPRTNNQEKRVLIQSIILFVNLTLLITAWHHYDLIASPSKETYFVINLYWIIYCGLNPFLYLTMSGKIRRTFTTLALCRKPRIVIPEIIFTTTTPNLSKSSIRK